ncbi:TIGR04282 family arsenosugar biosynthesis glycosyltransferase [soil metagenome]
MYSRRRQQLWRCRNILSMKSALIIFVRNPVLGKVKTRIAATLGDENALAVYKYLLQHTKDITEGLPVTRLVFYADEITTNDLWNGNEKYLQSGSDLGERMSNAFEWVLEKGYDKIIIIGSDCFELDEKMIVDAFLKLNEYEIVIGPATDGGYYLLGMQSPFKNLFQNITWSSKNVLNETIKQILQHNLSSYLLPALNDVDDEKNITFKWEH